MQRKRRLEADKAAIEETKTKIAEIQASLEAAKDSKEDTVLKIIILVFKLKVQIFFNSGRTARPRIGTERGREQKCRAEGGARQVREIRSRRAREIARGKG